MPLTGTSPRRRRLMEAATVVAADHGLRGLTHRAVDRQAGVAEGTCSAYFRTRRALHNALADHVAERLTQDVGELSRDMTKHPGDLARAADRTTKMFLRWLKQPELLRALLELTLEATRDAELAAGMDGWQRSLIDVVDATIAASGHDHSRQRAEALVSASYGVLLGALLHQPADRRDHLEQNLTILVDGLLGGGER